MAFEPITEVDGMGEWRGFDDIVYFRRQNQTKILGVASAKQILSSSTRAGMNVQDIILVGFVVSLQTRTQGKRDHVVTPLVRQ